MKMNELNLQNNLEQMLRTTVQYNDIYITLEALQKNTTSIL